MSVILLSFEPDKWREEWQAQVQAAAPDMDILVTRDRDRIEAVVEEIEIAALSFPHDLLPSARSLRWFQLWSAGADWLLRHPEVVDLDFTLTNTAGMHAIQISEHIFGFLLTFARKLHLATQAQARHKWIPQGEHSGLFELAGKTMVMIGIGAIGARTAQVAAAFEMRVLGVRRNPKNSVPSVEAMFGPGQLLNVLPQADFVVLAAPLTHETRGMIGERDLQAIKPTAYLINVGRGPIVDERALTQALQEGWIAGAGLDVFEEEPLPQDSPLWDADNVIITSHYAGITPHYDARAMAIFVDNLQRYQTGQPLRNVVDKALGY
jgi:phosphoglycerate dehydrogenase-like enzyme